MSIIKKLDKFILNKFLLTFAAAFMISLFVFMMQFTWRYVDELIGKGLSLDILAQFFWYMGLSLVPTALPLAVLLASLITFGNMGEQLELLAMKAAGVPLIRIMRPILMVAFLLCGVSFYFQNHASPKAQIEMNTLLFSMKQSSPAVEIPEGMFYSGVPNVNLYVQKKNAETGMLYQVIIYKTDQGFDQAQIVLADSGRMEITADKMHLKLDLWNGEQFENLQAQNISSLQASVPYDRETFDYKQFIIDFDSNFSMMDQQLLANMPQSKNMLQIEESVDSVAHRMDSVGRDYYRDTRRTHINLPHLAKSDSVRLKKELRKPVPSFDSLVAALPAGRHSAAMQQASYKAKSLAVDLEWKSAVTAEGDRFIRRHWIEWHQKITLSLACIFFFLVGAPLGAIIRKGGLGMPTVVSVLIFIFYYIVNTSGMKLARDGSWSIVFGMWISTAILLPLGIFLTYKANKDSVVFNLEAQILRLRRMLGLRSRRHIFRKEVIIDDPCYDTLPERLCALRDDCRAYSNEHRLILAPNYFHVFFRYQPDHRIEEINERMEALVEELSNSRDRMILRETSQLPIIFTQAHTTPLNGRRRNIVAGIVFPVGLLLWLRIWRFRLRLLRDLKQITKSCDNLVMFIEKFTGITNPPRTLQSEKHEDSLRENEPKE